MAQIQRLLAAVASPARSSGEPGAVVIQGPAGIGKTSLWHMAVAEAERAGLAVLQARPAEPETTYAYSGLVDLLRDHLPQVLARLPSGQQDALEIALGVGAAGSAAEALAADRVQSVVTNALLQLSAEKPLLLAIDDAQWLDQPTAAVIEFFARRIGSRPIGLVATQRVDEESPSAFGLDKAFTGRAVVRLWLEPLSLGALHKLLVQRLGLTLPRAHLLRLHELSGGVPFHALEIGRALARGPLPPIGAPLPIPVSLRDLLAARLQALPEVARKVMILTAVGGAVSRTALDDMVGHEQARRGVASAIDAGLLASEGGTVRVGHPLVASTALSVATPSEVRAAHEELARVVDEPEARARHRALAIEGTDEAVAAELEAAGRRTIERGAPERGAELFNLAMNRTPAADLEARARRLLALGDALYRAADLPAAAKVLDELLAMLPAGPSPTRARALVIRSEVAWYTHERAQAAVAHALAGLEAAADEPTVQADLHYRLAIFRDFDMAAAVEHSRRAVSLLESQDRPSLLASALFVQFAGEVQQGDPPPLHILERALAVEPPDSPDATTIPGIWLAALDRIDEARQRFLHLLELDRRFGQLSSEPDLLTRLAEVELFADNYGLAREYADAATAAAQQEGNAPADPSRRIRALIDAYEGNFEQPRAIAHAAVDRAESSGDKIIAVAWLVVTAFIAVSSEAHLEAIEAAERNARLLSDIGRREPMRLGLDHELAESLATLGRTDEAELAIAGLLERQARIDMPWRRAAVARAQAQLLSVRGRHEEAVALLDAMIAGQAEPWRRFDRARTMLLRGTVLRRARARREAAASLDEARAIFEQIGARVWAARASAEAERLGRHRPGTEALTPSEQQVAELAAAGLTNREVAERLTVSPKTVEAHLARTYAKLGIKSRAELGRLMGGPRGEGPGAI